MTDEYNKVWVDEWLCMGNADNASTCMHLLDLNFSHTFNYSTGYYSCWKYCYVISNFNGADTLRIEELCCDRNLELFFCNFAKENWSRRMWMLFFTGAAVCSLSAMLTFKWPWLRARFLAICEQYETRIEDTFFFIYIKQTRNNDF